jgi:hypothetical protein
MDLDRLAAVAIESFLREEGREREDRAEPRRGRLSRVGSVAVGVGLAVAARAAYNRARSLDLEQIAGSVEARLKG